MASMRSIRVGTFGGASAFPVLVAQRRGLFAAAGLLVDTERTTDSGALRDGLATGRLQVAHLAPDNVIAWRDGPEGGLPVPVVAWMAGSNGPIALVARDAASITALRGTRIGVDSPASGFVPILRRLLATAGLGDDDVTLVTMGATRRRAEALAEGAIDASMLTVPWSLVAAADGARLLADHRVVAPGLLTSCAASLERWLDGEGSDVAPAYADALTAALAWLRQPVVRPTAIEWLAEELGTSAALAAAVLDAMLEPGSGWPARPELEPGALDAVWAVRAEAFGRPTAAADAYLRPRVPR